MSDAIWTIEQIQSRQIQLDEMRQEAERQRRKHEARTMMINIAVKIAVDQMNAPLRALADGIRTKGFEQ